MIPLTVPGTGHLFAAFLARRRQPGHEEHWPGWRRTHQARAHWYHQRTRLARDTAFPLVS